MVNILWFQIGWWALVLSASKGYELYGFGASLFFLGIHFLFLSTSRKRDGLLLLLASPVGLLGDYLLIHFNVFETPGNAFPLWLVGLWLLFPQTLPYSMNKPFMNNLILPFLGMAAGFSYYAGNYFGFLITNEPVMINLSIAGFAWIVYLIIFRGIYSKLVNLQ